MPEDIKIQLVDKLIKGYSSFEEGDLLGVLDGLLMEKSTKELRQLYIDEGFEDD
jgi:hypothetical protein